MRIKLPHIALILAILALAVSLFTAVQVSRNNNDALIDALMAQTQQLQAQLDALSDQTPVTPDIPVGDSTITEITLTAAPWQDNRGADVTLTAAAENAPDGDALLRVMLGSTVITEVPCHWDGTALTATVSLDAANGYIYSLVVDSEAKTLASPDAPAYPELVYLSDALSAYCNLIVGDWYVRESTLTLETGYATIHTPQLTADDEAYTQVRLVLKRGEEVLAECPISPVETDEPGSFACSISSAAFPLPIMAEGEQMDLWLEATLTSGQILSTCAATWYAMPGGFSMAAG